MTVEEYLERSHYLKDLKKYYGRVYVSPGHALYQNEMIKELITKTNQELARIEECFVNYELDNSYDPNTGEYHKIYTEGSWLR